MHHNEFETAGVDHKSYVGVAWTEPKESVTSSLLNETVASKLKIRNISFLKSMLYLVLYQPNYQIYSLTSKAILKKSFFKSHFYPSAVKGWRGIVVSRPGGQMVGGWCGQVCESDNLRIKQCRIFNFIPKVHLLGDWGVAQARVSIFRNTFERYEIQNVFLYCFFVLFYFLQFYMNKSNTVVRWLSLLAHSKKYSDPLITWGLSGVEFARVGSLSSCKHIHLRLTHDSQLAIGLNFGMNGCLSFCVWV